MGSFLRVWVPTAGRERDYVLAVKGELETLQYLVEDSEAGSYRPFPAKEGLIPWGASLDGDVFYWKTNSTDPDRWPVVVGGASGSWSEREGGLIRFITDLAQGRFTDSELPEGVISAASPVVQLVG
ncbi:hypothetical protein ABT160_42425 [Streptomyces sp. NPDC001941]|uniref:hypothetical protein n=1 Tax=Streptomyces sp. NPDC001941 TaxID=3154659 RepID=UPI0033345ECB